MAKKKSKSQKYKQAQKKKNKNIQKKVKIVEKSDVSYNVALATQTKKEEPIEQKKPKMNTSKRRLVEKDKIIYNVPIAKEKTKRKNNNYKKPVQEIKPLTKKEEKKRKKILKNKEYEKQFLLEEEYNSLKEEKRKNRENELKQKNIFFRLFYEIKNNLHIVFNVTIILFIIVTLIGLIKTNIFETTMIIYIAIIIIFLSSVAISYNKHIEGRVFTILLCIAMGFAIYQMQYTYDFIRALNVFEYEQRTYYVVTFDNSLNKSIYNVNNKKVALLKDNCINVERMLNTKIEAKFLEYDDLNQMFEDFYDQQFRAVIVTENEYKYLENNTSENSRDVKILYEFTANAKK